MKKILLLPFRGFKDFIKDGGMIYSASLSYFFIVSLVPLLLFLITVFGTIMGESREFFEFMIEKLIGMFPSITTEITEEIRNLITFKGIGKLSFVLYALLSYQLYIILHKAMESVFKVEDKRSFIRSLSVYAVVVTMLMFVMFLSFALTSVIKLIKVLKLYFPWFKAGVVSSLLLQYVLPLFIVFSAAAVIYKIMPKTKVKVKNALYGGLFTAILLETAKYAFTWYMTSVMSMGTVYGSLSAFIVFLLWVYYASAIFLIGGEIVHALGES